MTSPRRPSLDELAAGEIDVTDLRALSRLADMYSVLDPVPNGLVERAQFGITLDALHAEIAELQRSDALAGARADEVTEAQSITFTSSQRTVMVTITPLSADSVRIDGWIAPGAGVAIELRLPAGSRHTTADEDGRFVFDDVARGLAQFVLRPAAGTDGTPVVTPSVEL
jgi:hypothetical protein